MFPTLNLGGLILIPAYPTLITLGLCLGFFWVSRRAFQWGLRREDALDLMVAMAVGAFLGARIYFSLVEQPQWFFENPKSILMFWRGGFVYFGGLIGAAVACFLFYLWRRFPVLPMIECLLPVLTGQMITGRLACFAAGCCYGRPTDGWWGVIFPPGSLAPSGTLIHPTQLYSAGFWAFLTIGLLLWERQRPDRNFLGLRVATVLILTAVFRFSIEFLRNDDRGAFLGGLSQAQVLSAIQFLIGAALFRFVRRHPTMIKFSYQRSS